VQCVTAVAELPVRRIALRSVTSMAELPVRRTALCCASRQWPSCLYDVQWPSCLYDAQRCAARHVNGRAACTMYNGRAACLYDAQRCASRQWPSCLYDAPRCAVRHGSGRAACIHSCHSCMTSHLLNLPKRSLHLIFCFSSTAWVCVHASDTDYTNLSNVFHDEWTLLDLLHGLDAPATAICRPEYADAMLASVLNNAVRTLWSALALVIALIDGRPRRQTNTTFRVVSKLRACVTSTARWSLLHTVCALTPDHRVLF